MSRLVGWVTSAAAVVSCVAAVVMVPEVRCMLRLPTEHLCQTRFAPARTPESDPSTNFQSASTTSAEASIAPIRALFEGVERDVAAGLYPSYRKKVRAIAADSAYLTIYTNGSEIRKVRARVFGGGVRTVWQAYYQGGELAFIYRTDGRDVGRGWTDFDQQRYYFAGRRMVRWLRGMRKAEVSPASSEYVNAEQQMRSLGARLLQNAQSPDPAGSI